uniref:RNA-directed RNA polymerase n=1 Tax=Coleopteran tombus-related virus TaxID=2822551 RepID=A0A8A6RKN8_9TOMB|nr:RNA-dependent RNA polymerase [Coleopteran tombus-related virus]
MVYFPSIAKPYKYFYYPQCLQSTAAAYYNRHNPQILDTYEPRNISRMYRHIRKFVCHPAAYTRQEYVDSMPTAFKRRQYQRVLDELNQGAMVRSTIEPFTKLEKFPTTKYKPPRMIQARHYTFNIAYGRFIKPLENYITKFGKHKHHFGKGNYDDIASNIDKLAKKYRYYTELDHDSFDARITVEMLTLSHKFYQACYHHNKELRELSKRTLNNKCKTRSGEKYKCYGSRMSGDVDTSFGNSIINYAIIKELLKQLKLKGDCIVNGDDCIIFTDEPIPIETSQEILATMNMKSKMQPSVTNIHHVEFCRTKLVYRSDGTKTMMMNPQRVYQTFGMTYRLNESKSYHRYLEEVMICNAIINMNTPIGHHWAALYGKPIDRTTPIQFKYVTRDLERIVEKQRGTIESSKEFTPSMFQAWPDSLQYVRKIRTIMSRPIPNNYMVVINHDSKRIAISYYNDKPKPP